MRRDRKKIFETIGKSDRFLLTGHVNPDGDSIGSQLALGHILRHLGKDVRIVNPHPVPRIYRFLDGADAILQRKSHSLRLYDAVFLLDCGTPSRATTFIDGPKPRPPVVNIDHHYTNEGYGDLNWVDAEACSTCEIIYSLAKGLSVPISRPLAEALYIGILTDTGSFHYSNTTPRAMRTASSLLRHGIDPHFLAERIYESSEYVTLRLLGKVLSRMGRTDDGEVTWITFSHKELSSLSSASETEEFMSYPRSVESARIALGFKETSPGIVRVSYRSKGEVNVADLAHRHGGGGHRNAAGCTVEGRLSSVVRSLVAEARRFLKESPAAPGAVKVSIAKRSQTCTSA